MVCHLHSTSTWKRFSLSRPIILSHVMFICRQKRYSGPTMHCDQLQYFPQPNYSFYFLFSFNILVVGSCSGRVRLVAYGTSHIAEIDLTQAAQITQVSYYMDMSESHDRHVTVTWHPPVTHVWCVRLCSSKYVTHYSKMYLRLLLYTCGCLTNIINQSIISTWREW